MLSITKNKDKERSGWNFFNRSKGKTNPISILEKLDGIGNTQLMTMGIGSFVYSSLLMTEGIGLWLEKRWAEFLTVIATSLLIPLELYEIMKNLHLCAWQF